jgi:hypothetical protein
MRVKAGMPLTYEFGNHSGVASAQNKKDGGTGNFPLTAGSADSGSGGGDVGGW